MKERKGPLGLVAGFAEDLVAGQRRRQARREPRVAVYDRDGRARVLQEGAAGRTELLEIAEEMSGLVVPE
ncbi:MAG TPA: hypothetical protein VFL87_04380 [Thermoleophilaceae bacterium]|nr:hypothetical protein [Thermoleophilaceae bacterium]